MNAGHPRAADLLADVQLYAAVVGGKACPVTHGYRCVCLGRSDLRDAGWESRLHVGDEPFEPGSERRVGLEFLTTDDADAIRQAGHFYLWDGRIIGEGKVVR